MHSFATNSCYNPRPPLQRLRQQLKTKTPLSLWLSSLSRQLHRSQSGRYFQERTCNKQRCWVIYNPVTGYPQCFFSVDDLRTWLDRCYHQ